MCRRPRFQKYALYIISAVDFVISDLYAIDSPGFPVVILCE